MNPWCIIKAEWRRSRVGMLALALVLGLSVCLGLTVSMVERGIRQGAAQAGDAFDLLVGAPGSPTQLMLSAVYLQPQALPLFPYDTFERVKSGEGVNWAAPLAFGDRWKEYPLIGTTPDMVTLGKNRALAEGVPFSEYFEHNEAQTGAGAGAVVGALVPLKMNEEFSPAHGLVAVPDGQDVHDHAHFTVTGRLPLTGTPWDRAILVPLAAVWGAHGLHKGDAQAGISAVVVKPRSVADAYKLRNLWKTPSTQAVFTGEVLTELFAALGDVRTLMQSMAVVSQGTALGGVILATLFAVALRRDTLSLLRTLGAPRLYLLLSVWSLAAGVIVLGVLSGLALAVGVAHVTAEIIWRSTATLLPVSLSATEWGMAALFVAVGLLVACTPAVTVYRRKSI